MIQSRGFQFEQHFIENEQGYILQLIRIVNPFHKDRNRLKPILLHHGFQGSGSAWLINRNGHLDQDGNYLEYDENFETILSDSRKEIGNSLGFVLAQKNFDVWLANYRGNFYSTNHTRLNVNGKTFDFDKSNFDFNNLWPNTFWFAFKMKNFGNSLSMI